MKISNLPLQDLIAGVVKTASDNLAASQDTEDKIKDEVAPGKKSSSREEDPESWTDPSYVEKLASACDFISQNVENISVPERGVLGSALAKLGGEPVPPTNPKGALEAEASVSGTQKYKHDKPAGEDAAASQAETPETSAGLPAGKTQISNNMEKAPGQESGSVPKAEYPPAGPLHSGPEKTAAQIAREKILRKLAGEDVAQANITSDKSGGPLVGDGEMDAYEAEQVPGNPTDGSGYGNEGRKHIKSNQGAIDYTKGQAKKLQVPQLGELLSNPAFSPAHDSKLREQLQNSGKAGVKIAGAKSGEFLKQAAAKGVLTQEMVDQFKEKQAQMTPPDASGGQQSGGMTSLAAGDAEEMKKGKKTSKSAECK